MSIEKLHEKYRNELFGSCIPFWVNFAQDRENGGVFSCLDRAGNLYSTDKSVWMQGRAAWMFSKLCNVYGAKPEWLSIAESCIGFLDRHCVDKADGRMYFTVTAEGLPLRKRRYFFSETFYIMANAEFYGATGDKDALSRARSYYDFVLNMYRDAEADPYKITPKTIESTRKTKALSPPMILLNVTSVMRQNDPDRAAMYDITARALIGDIIENHYHEELNTLLESVSADGKYENHYSAGRVINPGHVMEACWFMLDAADAYEDKTLTQRLADIFVATFNLGWDENYGGIKYFIDAERKPVEAYEHDMKLWWPHCEALIGAAKFYEKTGEQRFLDIFNKTDGYAFPHFSDPAYGEWFGYLRRDGKPTEPPVKGHTYKGPFHVPRMLMTVEQILSSACLGTRNTRQR